MGGGCNDQVEGLKRVMVSASRVAIGSVQARVRVASLQSGVNEVEVGCNVVRE